MQLTRLCSVLLLRKEGKSKYGIFSTQSINRWLRKFALVNYDRDKIFPVKQTPKERIKELAARIKKLEDDKIIFNTTIDVIDEMYNTDIRKKYLPQSLKKFRKNKSEGKLTSFLFVNAWAIKQDRHIIIKSIDKLLNLNKNLLFLI